MQPLTSRLTSIIGTYHLATEPERIHGRRWYAQAHSAALKLSGAHPVGVITAAGVIAALSPNNKWERNLTDADALIGTYHQHGTHAAAQLKVCTYNANKQKALTLLKLHHPTIEDVATVLHGRKITAFYRCILGSQTAVCIDGHAFAIWAGHPIPTTQTPKIGPRLYEQIARDYATAAVMINTHKPTAEPLTPAQLQATVWITHRRMIQR